MRKVIRIIAATVDVQQLRLYLEDGSTIDIPQGDPRLAGIVKQITPIIEAGLVASIEYDDGENAVVPDTHFADFEKKSGKFTRFFRVAKSVLGSILGTSEVEKVSPREIGKVAITGNMVVEKPLVASDKMEAAIDDIIAHAKPASHPTFHDPIPEKKATDTIVAVVETEDGKRGIVPGVEALGRHVGHSVKFDNTKGMDAFLGRIAKVANQRGHTATDILKFMERGDLPLADDGTIIAYKVLTTKDGMNKEIFVDCHSRQVTQRVGSFVRQNEKIIDRSRSHECGVGLHIARRAYLRGFSGNIIVMVKIRPEDVLAVPHGESDKIRASGYHIIGKVPADEHERLRSNKPMEGTNALKMLTMAIEGDHIGIIEYVDIGGPKGTQLTVTPVEGAVNHKPQPTKETPVTVAVPDPVAPPKKEDLLTAPAVDPKAIAKDLTETRKDAPAKPTKAQQARVLYEAGKLEELNTFKKAAKKSWEALGFTHEEIVLFAGPDGKLVAKSPMTNGQPTAAEPTATTTATTDAASSQASPTPKELKMSGTRAEVARELYNQATNGDKSRWGSLWRHQKECKKSWAILGFNAKEIERIKTNKSDWI